MLASYAQELQALKAELQHTLARLGDVSSANNPSATNPAPALPFATPREPSVGSHHARYGGISAAAAASTTVPTTSRTHSTPSWSVATTRTIATATSDTVSSSASSHRHQQAHVPDGITVDARQLMQELRNAAQRRRELEMQFANEMRRENEQMQQRQRDACAPWQNAIAALQRQRAEIIRQIELESQTDPFAGESESSRFIVDTEKAPTGKARGSQKEPPKHSSPDVEATPPARQRQEEQSLAGGKEHQYSIEGVVTLEPLQNSSSQIQSSAQQQRVQHATIMSTRNRNPLFKRDIYGRPESHHETLNEVFSIQLKFAETMLKLEKSVQVRDQLLHTRKNTATGRYRNRDGVQKLTAHRARAAVNRPVQPDSDGVYEGDLSSECDSFSSGASLGHYAWKLKRYASDNDDGIHDLAPSTPSTTHSAAAPNSGTSTIGPAPSSPKAEVHHENRADLSAVEEEEKEESETTPSSAAARTPSTESSDKTTSSSANKQVRFDDRGEYATPLIARKFSFGSQSDDDGGYEDSLLSFMDGSSVTSSDLNDASLLQAFEAFRHELALLKQPSQLSASSSGPSGISAAITAARALFTSDELVDSAFEDDLAKPEKDVLKASKKANALGDHAIVKRTRDSDSVDGKDEDPDAINAILSASKAPPHQALQQSEEPQSHVTHAELAERRRQLCLDIQAESAQLVLTFGSRNAHQTERIKQNLIHLRQQLRTLDEQLNKP